MRIAIVDDLTEEAERFRLRCADWAEAHGVTLRTDCFSCGEHFLERFACNAYEMVFMDVYLKDGLNGVEVARRLREQDRSVLLVFLTTSSDFMPDAFSCRAYDYLVKPADDARFDRLMADAMRLLPENGRYLELSSGAEHVRQPVSELVSAVTDGHYLLLGDCNGRVLRLRMTMAQLQAMLGGEPSFLLVNRGVLVNMDFVRALSDDACLMRDGASFPLMLKARDDIRNRLEDYRFLKMHREQENRRS